MLPITDCAVAVVINPAGPVHTVVTVTETSTAGLNITVQVRVTADSTGRIGEAGILEIFTEFGAGAVACRDASSYLNNIFLCILPLIVTF